MQAWYSRTAYSTAFHSYCASAKPLVTSHRSRMGILSSASLWLVLSSTAFKKAVARAFTVRVGAGVRARLRLRLRLRLRGRGRGRGRGWG